MLVIKEIMMFGMILRFSCKLQCVNFSYVRNLLSGKKDPQSILRSGVL
jgi:hypothetical protein